MWRAKEKTDPANRAGTIKGIVILRKVVWASAPKLTEASSIEGSICCNAAMPARADAGKLRTT